MKCQARFFVIIHTHSKGVYRQNAIKIIKRAKSKDVQRF